MRAMKRKADEAGLDQSNVSNLWLRGPLVGVGSCGSVYAAISKNSKILPMTMAVKSAKLVDADLLRKEKRVLSKFKGCPFVIQCYGEDITIGGEDGKTLVYNLLLEYAYGGNLGDVIDRTGGCGLSEPEVRLYTRCILQGLSGIHQSGYVHCDIKPDNILMVTHRCSFSPTDRVEKICDFGMVRKVGKKASLRGSPMYMAPESVNFGVQGQPSDIWALGCVVLKMLTGKPPWNIVKSTDHSENDVDQDAMMMDLFSRIGSEQESPSIPDNISEEGRDFLKCCFERIPAQRWSACELLSHRFVRFFKEASDKNGAFDEGEEVLNSEEEVN